MPASQPVGPEGPFSGLISGASASAASWYTWGAMGSAPVYLAGPVAGFAGSLGYVGGLKAGKLLDETYKEIRSKTYSKPAIAYSNEDLVLVSAASIPVSYYAGKYAAGLGAGMAATAAAAGAVSLFSTIAFLSLNNSSTNLLDTIKSWFSGKKKERPASKPKKEAKKKKAKCTGMIGSNTIDGRRDGSLMKRENTCLAF